jgi:phosphocarrier protein
VDVPNDNHTAYQVRRVTVSNERGLHARAAAKFVKLAATFDADVTVAKNETEVPGGSIMALMMLAAGPGCELEVRARGREADAALAALTQLVMDRFHEE